MNVEVLTFCGHTLYELDAIVAKNKGDVPLTYQKLQVHVVVLTYGWLNIISLSIFLVANLLYKSKFPSVRMSVCLPRLGENVIFSAPKFFVRLSVGNATKGFATYGCFHPCFSILVCCATLGLCHPCSIIDKRWIAMFYWCFKCKHY